VIILGGFRIMVGDFLGGRLSNKSNREGLPFAALSPAPHLGR